MALFEKKKKVLTHLSVYECISSKKTCVITSPMNFSPAAAAALGDK